MNIISTRRTPNDTRCLIVMYHYVRPIPDPELPFFRALTPSQFENQIQDLSRDWSFVSLNDYVAGLNGVGELPKRCCILSFDDGVRDHYDHVLPVLDRFNIPGVFFPCSRPIAESIVLDVHMIQHLVARLAPEELASRLVRIVRLVLPDLADGILAPNPAEVDQAYYYEPQAEIRWAKYVLNFMLPFSLQREVIAPLFEEEFGDEEEFSSGLYLSPKELQEMSEMGMTIGSHGHQHIPMSYCDLDQKQEDLSRSKRLIESWTGRPVTAFSYPWGGLQHIDEESQIALIDQGYQCALTTLDGVNEVDSNPFYLHREDCIRVPGVS